MEKYNCTRCKHEWYPRTPNKPKVCPKCKSPYWDTPYKKGKDDFFYRTFKG